jgi:hypothetical protein
MAFDWQSVLSQAKVNKRTTLADTPFGPGLKEALKVGIDRTVQLVGKKDGYFADPLIKIPMPEKLSIIEKALRKIGMSRQVDEFVLSMNRAAEKAAPYARDIFIDAITKMSIEDAQQLMNGGDTAATKYFDKTTRPELTALFKPMVKSSMQDYAVTRQYSDLMAQVKKIPLVGKFKQPDIESYVVNKSLDGMFFTLGEQEKQIRQDPAARTTDLLRKVFGNKG